MALDCSGRSTATAEPYPNPTGGTEDRVSSGRIPILGELENGSAAAQEHVEGRNHRFGFWSGRRLVASQARIQGSRTNRLAPGRGRRRKAADPPVQESDFKTTETLELSPLPCLANLETAQQRDLIQSTIEKIVATAAAARGVKGTMVLGAARLQAASAYPAKSDQEVAGAEISRLRGCGSKGTSRRLFCICRSLPNGGGEAARR